MLLFSLVGCLFTYAILRLQYFLPLNPQGLAGVSPDCSFNTATSFTTNTNWQSYGGESTMSYFSQMVGLAFHNFVSAATGIAIAAALVRGIARHTANTIGNFWVDLVRVTYYLLIPICLVFAVFLVSQGMIQNFKPYTKATLVEPMKVSVAKVDKDGKPVVDAARQTRNGRANRHRTKHRAGADGIADRDENARHQRRRLHQRQRSASVRESDAAFKFLPDVVDLFHRQRAHLLPRPNGKEPKTWLDGLGGDARAVYRRRFACMVGGIGGNPIHQNLGVAAADGNMEGKEVRFGIFNSALFATITTDASCGAVNSMHDSFTPLGGFVPLFNIQLGEIIFGGVGAGLYGMLVFVVLAVFIAGLMVGRTPEYLGKKIEAYDVKMAMLALLILAIDILAFSAWAIVSKWGLVALNNSGPHGLSEILYAYTSGTGNNGSAFAGISANTPWLNTTIGFAMLIGRFLMIVPILGLAGSLVRKKVTPVSAGTFPVHGGTFFVLLIGTVLLIGALNFLPALALGPIVEHFLMLGGKLF